MTSGKQQFSAADMVKTAFASVVMALAVHTWIAEIKIIPSGSMQPTLQVGNRLLVEKISYKLITPPQRRDIIVFNAPEALRWRGISGSLIKRIVGVPGDTVEIRQGQVYVNGSRVQEPYTAEPGTYSYGPVTLEPENYFVLGDNRNESYDSHYWGFVKRQDITGKAILRIYPPNKISLF